MPPPPKLTSIIMIGIRVTEPTFTGSNHRLHMKILAQTLGQGIGQLVGGLNGGRLRLFLRWVLTCREGPKCQSGRDDYYHFSIQRTPPERNLVQRSLAAAHRSIRRYNYPITAVPIRYHHIPSAFHHTGPIPSQITRFISESSRPRRHHVPCET